MCGGRAKWMCECTLFENIKKYYFNDGNTPTPRDKKIINTSGVNERNTTKYSRV